jgi:hypothetical protein
VEGIVAQVTFNLTEAQITGQQQQTVAAPSGRYGGGALGQSIEYKSNNLSGNFTPTAGSPDLALNAMFLRITAGAGLNLGGGQEINLSKDNQAIFTALLALGASNLEITYRLPIAGRAWNAGIYTSTNSITMVLPTSILMTINVPSFITVNTLPPTATLNVASLANFRTGSLTGSHVFDYFTSLAADVKVKATNTNNFSFSTTEPKIVDPSPAASLLKAHVTVPSLGSPVSLTNGDQDLLTNIAVQATNKRSITTNFSLSAADLKASFVQAGTYTLPITYSIAKHSTAYGTALTATTTSSVHVVVPRLFECVIPTANLLFDLSNINSYRNGITVAIPNPFVVSSTIPYNITVKASGDFTNGSGGTIPANTVTVEGTAAQTGITSVILSAVDQSLVTGAAPVIDRSLNLQYRISPTQATNMLGKTAGTYQNTITFTCTAP